MKIQEKERLKNLGLAALASFFFCVAAMLSLLVQNADEARLSDVVRPSLVAFAICCCLFLLYPIRVFGERISVLVVIGFAVLFYHDALTKNLPSFLLHLPVRYSIQAVLIQLFVIALIFSITFFQSARNSLWILLATASAMFATGAAQYVSLERGDPVQEVALDPLEIPNSSKPAYLPDIFYIVPDRYANASVLRRELGFDNSSFLEALEARGFFVTTDAYANYPTTAQSLASSLNMSYLDGLAASVGLDSSDQRPLIDLIYENRVQRILKRLGYRIVHLGTFWKGTNTNSYADVVFRSGSSIYEKLRLSEFEAALIDRTPLRSLLRRLSLGKYVHCQDLKEKLAYLRDLPEDPRPTFVFAHLMLPHPPIVADRDGNCLEENLGAPLGELEPDYREFIEFGNKSFLEVFDSQARKGRDLVFIIQADEGPYPQGYQETSQYLALDDDVIRTKLGIINAIYLSGGDYRRFNENLSPVNLWRLVFSEIYGKDIDLLEEKLYIFKNESKIYDFYDVSGIKVR